MPFINIVTDLNFTNDQKREIIKSVTETAVLAINTSNPPPRGRKYNISISVVDPYGTGIDGVTLADGATFPTRVDISSFDIGPEQVKSLVAHLTPKMAQIMGIENSPELWNRIWVRFLPFAVEDFAVGGKFVFNKVSMKRE